MNTDDIGTCTQGCGALVSRQFVDEHAAWHKKMDALQGLLLQIDGYLHDQGFTHEEGRALG